MDLSTVQTPMFNAVMGVITVFSLAFAVYSHHSNSSKQKLRYAVAGRTILSRERLSSFADVDISAAGQSVSDLYYVVILIFNSGSIAVEPASLAEGAIKIGYRKTPEAPEPQIVLSRVAEVDDPAGDFQLRSVDGPQEDQTISFNYIAPKSGFAVEIVSTRKHTDFYVNAKTKSFGAIRKSTPLAKVIGPSILILPIVILLSAFPISDYISGIIAPRFGLQPFDFAPSMAGFFISVIGVFGFGALLFFAVRRGAHLIMKPSILKFYREVFTN